MKPAHSSDPRGLPYAFLADCVRLNAVELASIAHEFIGVIGPKNEIN